MKTKGELVTACIKLMFDNGESYIDPENVSYTLGDNDDTPTGSDIEAAEYAHRTANIIEAINRAFYRVYSYGKLPSGEMTIDKDTSQVTGTIKTETTFYDLSTIKSDYGRMSKIIYINDDGKVISNIPVTRVVGGKVILPTISKGYYLITYERKVIELKYSDADTLDLTTYGYTEEMLAFIPYFVKADLYEEDNPQMAQASRNIFEVFIQGLPSNDTDTYDVEDVINIW